MSQQSFRGIFVTLLLLFTNTITPSHVAEGFNFWIGCLGALEVAAREGADQGNVHDVDHADDAAD